MTKGPNRGVISLLGGKVKDTVPGWLLILASGRLKCRSEEDPEMDNLPLPTDTR